VALTLDTRKVEPGKSTLTKRGRSRENEHPRRAQSKRVLGLRQGGKLDQVGLRLAFEELLQGGLDAFFGGKIYTEGINVLLILVKLEM
jgi:hypothetical protein